MVMLIAGGSLSTGSHDPYCGTLMPLGPSTPSVGVKHKPRTNRRFLSILRGSAQQENPPVAVGDIFIRKTANSDRLLVQEVVATLGSSIKSIAGGIPSLLQGIEGIFNSSLQSTYPNSPGFTCTADPNGVTDCSIKDGSGNSHLLQFNSSDQLTNEQAANDATGASVSLGISYPIAGTANTTITINEGNGSTATYSLSGSGAPDIEVSSPTQTISPAQ